MHSASVVLDNKYSQHWSRIKELTNEGAEHLVSAIESYINILSSSQHDTYTNPFEIVSPNMGKLDMSKINFCKYPQIL